MAKKSTMRTLYDLPVEVTCTICWEIVKVPANKFSADGGSYICKLGGHEFPLSQKAAQKAVGDHGRRLDRIRQTYS